MNILKETTEIVLDLSCRHAPLRLYAKQGDIGSRFISARFCFGGRDFDLSQVQRSEIRVKKPDDTITVNEGVISENRVEYPLTDQSLTVSGEGQADFLLYGSGDKVISCIPAQLTIAEMPVGDESVVSLNEYTAFREEFDGLSESVEGLDSRVSAAEKSINRLNSNFGGLCLATIPRNVFDHMGGLPPTTVFFVLEEDGGISIYLDSVMIASSSWANQ